MNTLRRLLLARTPASQPCVRLVGIALLWLVGGQFGSSVEAEESPIGFRKLQLTSDYYCDGVTSGDIDGDGHIDVVAGPFWFAGPDFKTGHSFYPPRKLPPAESPSNSMFSFVRDFDDDGDLDILVLGRVHKHSAKWYQNPGHESVRKQRSWPVHEVFPRVRGESPTLTSIRGGHDRQLLCHWEGRWGWLEPKPGEPTAPWRFRAVGEDLAWPQFYHGQGVGDVNGDGRLDIVINDGWYEQPEDEGENGLWTFHRGRFSAGRGGAQMLLHDVDADGDQDVISAIDAHGWGLAWYEQKLDDGVIRFQEHRIMGDRSEESRFGAAFSQPHALALADLDGDGKLDVITGKRRWAHGPKGDVEPNAEPVVYWFRLDHDNEGQPFYTPYRVDDASGVGVQIHIADVNADHRPDILTASKLGVFVFLNVPR